MSNEKKDKNKNPFAHFWDMATGGLLSSFSDAELVPNKNAGKKRTPASTKKATKSVAKPKLNKKSISSSQEA